MTKEDQARELITLDAEARRPATMQAAIILLADAIAELRDIMVLYDKALGFHTEDD